MKHCRCGADDVHADVCVCSSLCVLTALGARRWWAVRCLGGGQMECAEIVAKIRFLLQFASPSDPPPIGVGTVVGSMK